MKRIELSSPHLNGKEGEYIKEAFESGWIAPKGENIIKLEQQVAALVGAKAALAVNSCTAALHLGLRLLGVGKGDIVFCSTLTFVASVNPITYLGAIPVFIDSQLDGWGMAPEALEKAFEKYTPTAVVVVQLFGQSSDMDKINAICNSKNVPVLEDSAEALGAKYNGKFCGTLGKLGAFSFNGNKIVTTSGGGMLVSDDEESIEKARFWAHQSKDSALHYQHSELGYNYALSNICAGIGRAQLIDIKIRIEKKQQIYQMYKQEFEDCPNISLYNVISKSEPNYWLSCATVDNGYKTCPVDIIEQLLKNNIASRPIWKPMHLQPYYMHCPFFSQESGISVAERVYSTGLCLPSDILINKEDVKRVCKIVKKAVCIY